MRRIGGARRYRSKAQAPTPYVKKLFCTNVVPGTIPGGAWDGTPQGARCAGARKGPGMVPRRGPAVPGARKGPGRLNPLTRRLGGRDDVWLLCVCAAAAAFAAWAGGVVPRPPRSRVAPRILATALELRYLRDHTRPAGAGRGGRKGRAREPSALAAVGRSVSRSVGRRPGTLSRDVPRRSRVGSQAPQLDQQCPTTMPRSGVAVRHGRGALARDGEWRVARGEWRTCSRRPAGACRRC